MSDPLREEASMTIVAIDRPAMMRFLDGKFSARGSYWRAKSLMQAPEAAI